MKLSGMEGGDRGWLVGGAAKFVDELIDLVSIHQLSLLQLQSDPDGEIRNSGHKRVGNLVYSFALSRMEWDVYAGLTN